MFFRFCSECSHSWPITKGHFYKNFQGFTYCSVFNVLLFVVVLATARLYYHSCSFLSTTFLKFFRTAHAVSTDALCLVRLSFGQGISYHYLRQMSTPFCRNFSNCFNCIYNSLKENISCAKCTEDPIDLTQQSDPVSDVFFIPYQNILRMEHLLL